MKLYLRLHCGLSENCLAYVKFSLKKPDHMKTKKKQQKIPLTTKLKRKPHRGLAELCICSHEYGFIS